MDIERNSYDFDELITPDLGDAGDLPPDEPEPPEEPPRRGPQSKPPPRERVRHGMTLIICAVSVVMSGLFLLAMHMSQSGGGISAAYVLSFSIAFVFLGTFYIGSLWLGAKRRGPFETGR